MFFHQHEHKSFLCQEDFIFFWEKSLAVIVPQVFVHKNMMYQVSFFIALKAGCDKPFFCIYTVFSDERADPFAVEEHRASKDSKLTY